MASACDDDACYKQLVALLYGYLVHKVQLLKSNSLHRHFFCGEAHKCKNVNNKSAAKERVCVCQTSLSAQVAPKKVVCKKLASFFVDHLCQSKKDNCN